MASSRRSIFERSPAILVLSRKLNESIRIGVDGGIEITIVDIRGDKVRIGITAPTEVPVHRQEIWEAIERERRRRPDPPRGTQVDADTAGGAGEVAR